MEHIHRRQLEFLQLVAEFFRHPDAQAAPNSTNDVYFSATNAVNLTTILGQNQSIKGLFFTGTSGTTGAVTIAAPTH